MAIYQVREDVDRYEILTLANFDEAWESVYQKFNGSPMAESWRPLPITVCREENTNKECLSGDFPYVVGLESALVFSSRAVEILEPLLKSNGELLSLEHPKEKYSAFNPTCLADVLNFDESDIVYFSTGRIMTIRRYVFDADKIPSNDIFKLTQISLGDTFVSEEFKLAVEENHLEGLLFNPVELTR